MNSNSLPKIRKVATWMAPNSIAVTQTTMPELKKGELLIKVMACSVCGSDLRIFKNGNPRVKSGQIVGHEIAGTVVAANAVSNFSIGDNVSIGADVPCNNCKFCNSGHCNCCRLNLAIGHQLEGGFTEFLKLDHGTVKNGPIQKFNNSLQFEHAALAEPLACCINGYEKCGNSPFETVLIFGAGPIGVLLGLLGKYYGAKTVIMVDPNKYRLQAAKKLGACDHSLIFENDNIIEKVSNITAGEGCDRIFTACPVSDTHRLAIELVSVMGVVNLFGGLPNNEKSIELKSNLLHYKEATLTGSHGSTPLQHKKALKLIEGGQIDVSAMITHKFSLDEIQDAYACAISGKGLKIVIMPNLESNNRVS